MPLLPQIGLISPQNFEIIRDRIVEILTVEFPNQVLQGLPVTCSPAIYRERTTQIDISAGPATIVKLSHGSYIEDGQPTKDEQGCSPGLYIYYIDTYVGLPTPTQTGTAGTELSIVTLQRITGVIRAILDHPVYATLGFEPRAAGIWTTHVREIYNDLPRDSENVDNCIWGRLIFFVKATEFQALVATPVDITQITTNMTPGTGVEEIIETTLETTFINPGSDTSTVSDPSFSVNRTTIVQIDSNRNTVATFYAPTDFPCDTDTQVITALTFTFLGGAGYLVKT